MFHMQSAAATKKQWSSFKARTCPTLNINPCDVPQIVPQIAIVVLGTMYNVLTAILSTHNPSLGGGPAHLIFLRVFFVVAYFFTSAGLVALIGSSRGWRRILGLWVGPKQFAAFLHLWAVTSLIGVICTAVILTIDDTYDPWPCGGYQCRETAYSSFPWMTTAGWVLMLLVTWMARSEPEILEDRDLEEGSGEDHASAGLPAYSLIPDDTSEGVGPNNSSA